MTIAITPQTKKARYVQLRLYLPADIVGPLKKLAPPIRNAVLAARIRALRWDLDFDLKRLENSLELLREACVLAKQLRRKKKLSDGITSPDITIHDIMENILHR
jgi:hypothetical protein